MPLQTIYRSKTLDEIVGNTLTIRSLKAVLDREEDIPHAYLLTGPSGTGKTTVGRIIASELGCSPSMLSEYNSSSYRGIDMVRELDVVSRLAPMDGKVRVYLFDEAHQITPSAQEALLKIIEDAPEKAFFIFSTTEPDKLKDTLKRRCHTASMKSLTKLEIKKMISHTIFQEFGGDDANDLFSGKFYDAIYEESEGSPGIALKLLDSVIDNADESEDELIETIKQESAGEREAIEIARHLMKNAASESEKAWLDLAKIIKGLRDQNENAEKLRRLIASYCTSCLLNGDNPKAGYVLTSIADDNYNATKFTGLVSRCYQIIMG